MDLASTVINSAVVAAVGLILAWLGKGRFQAIDRQLQAMQPQIDSMRAEFRGSLDALRSDLTQVALVVGARPRAENA